MGKEYINYNGKLIEKSENIFGVDNRAFKYADGLFESMHATANKVQLFEQHIQRLTKGMDTLSMKIPVKFRNKAELLHQEINTLTNKNLQFKGSRIRLNVFRNPGGLYTPTSNKISYIIESQALPTANYTLNKQGLLIEIYDEQLKSINTFNYLKSVNSLFFVMAGIFKQKNKFDECLILNEQGNVVESISSNVFLVKDNKIYTPPLSSGCLPGIMRQNIIELIQSLNMEIECNKAITINDFEQADEVFLTNAVRGIQWVVGFRHRRYYNNISKKLIKELNIQLVN